MNLIPTPRTDKNGVTSIRHMRPETASKSLPVSLPAPIAFHAASTPMSREAVIKALEESVEAAHDSAMLHYAACADVQVLQNSLKKLDDHVARAFYDYITENPASGRDGVLISVLNRHMDSGKAGDIVFVARNFPVEDEIDLVWDDFSYSTDLFNTAEKYVNGLRSVNAEHKAPKDILKASAEEQSQLTALIRVTMTVCDVGRKTQGIKKDQRSYETVLEDANLITLALERHEEVDSIVSIIRERKAFDAATVSAVLDAGVSVLRNGAL